MGRLDVFGGWGACVVFRGMILGWVEWGCGLHAYGKQDIEEHVIFDQESMLSRRTLLSEARTARKGITHLITTLRPTFDCFNKVTITHKL